MKTLLSVVVGLAIGLSSFGASRTLKEILKTPVKDLTPEEYVIRTEHIRKMKLKVFGGDIVKAGSQQGKIVFVNTQTVLNKAEIEKATATLRSSAKFNFEIQSTEIDENFSLNAASDLRSKFNAQIVVILINNPVLPTTLVAPEERWALVNINKLSAGLVSGPLYEKMFAARCRKEIIRTFSLLCGGGSSQFPGNMMATASVKDLDMVQEFIPIDMGARWIEYLKNLGVKPAYQCTYKQACIEGWAPAPTNDIQKAIWDKVHAMPTAPLKIRPETKKVKE